MAKRLPRGLREFEADLHDLAFTPELLTRLLDLPENGLRPGICRFDDALVVVVKAEEAASSAREAARGAALAVWKDAKAHWTIAELQEATGYKG